MSDISYKLFIRAFSSKTRLDIIKHLSKKGASVSDISNSLGFEQSRVSHNLACLAECGFVEVNRKGKQRIYSLNRKTILPMLRLMDRHIKKYHKHLKECGVLK
ncbi:MAG: winged helix-turn-helix transcriptional regulator [Candidatus Aenigmarchaeota archaeon]|nr:winged helix-turn-helix transcriptional regulator [Candidatus Aenigmarchaeota archaeon]